MQNLFYVSTLNKIINTVLKKKYLEKNPWNLQEIQIGPFYFILDPKKSKKQELRITNKKKYLRISKIYIKKYSNLIDYPKIARSFVATSYNVEMGY